MKRSYNNEAQLQKPKDLEDQKREKSKRKGKSLPIQQFLSIKIPNCAIVISGLTHGNRLGRRFAVTLNQEQFKSGTGLDGH